MKIFKKRLGLTLLVGLMLIHWDGYAQTVNQSQRSFKRNAATVIFSSLGGGILGLSTLSFYGKPQEHTDNITTGVAVGLLAGVVYVFLENESRTYNEVKSPWIPDFFKEKTQEPKKEIFPALSLNIDF